MKTQGNTINQKSDSKWLGAGLIAAVAASLCCITPVLALFAGVGGVAATFSWLEPFRPYLIGMTVLVLGFAWYQKLKPRTAEEIACDCEEDGKEPFFQSKKFLGVVTILAIVLLSFPSYSYIFYPDSQKDQVFVESSSVHQVNLQVKGMTCSACEEHVKHAVNQLDGVLKADASFENGNAIITFDESKTTLDEVVAAVNETGYKVMDVKRQTN